MTFAYPIALLAPLLLFSLLMWRKEARPPLPHPDGNLLGALPPSWRIRLREPVLGTLTALFLFCLGVAAARPQKTSVVEEPRYSRNLMIAIDLSRSMETADFASTFGRIPRFEAVRHAVSEFIRNRKDDRIGLVVFGSSAFLQSPLTLDHELVAQLVERVEVGAAGDGTAIGDGMGLALKRLEDVPGRSKALILLTDGVNNAGQVNPIKAAQVAKDLGVKVHTIGIGSNGTVASPYANGILSPRVSQQAEFDEKMLKEIASITGGVYFNAASVDGLKKVYDEIDKLEKTEADEPRHQITAELYAPFALAALAAYLLELLLARSVFLRIP